MCYSCHKNCKEMSRSSKKDHGQVVTSEEDLNIVYDTDDSEDIACTYVLLLYGKKGKMLLWISDTILLQ